MQSLNAEGCVISCLVDVAFQLTYDQKHTFPGPRMRQVQLQPFISEIAWLTISSPNVDTWFGF